MTEEEQRPKFMGLQWLLSGLVMVVVPIWAIVWYYVGGHTNLPLVWFSFGVITYGGFIMTIGVRLILKYDLHQS